MKYTKEQINGMSDFEVNNLIIKLSYDKLNTEKGRFVSLHSVHQDGNSNAAVYFANHKSGEVVAVGLFDFSNWNDIMPLAVEHGVNYGRVICPAGSGAAYYAKQIDGDIITSYEPTPQRAIACCLILVLQEQQQ
jgi:hypothetical protein